MSFFSHVVGLEAVSGEFANVDASKSINFASNPVLGKTPKFVDLQLSTVNTAEKLNSVFDPLPERKDLHITPTSSCLDIILRKLGR